MSNTIIVEVPDIGDFDAVDVIEILVAVGEFIEMEASLVTLETDKATMDIPCPQAGTVEKILLKVGDQISQGHAILEMTLSDCSESTEQAETVAQEAAPTQSATETSTTAPQTATDPGNTDLQAEVVVLGSGPGGYTAAFRAADLGKKVILIERYSSIGGVCLNVGCIPSKALLHTAEIINEAEEMSAHGVTFSKPEIDLEKLAGWKNKVIGKLTGGLAALAKQRKVTIVTGVGTLTSPHTIDVVTGDTTTSIRFDNLIIAAGSQATQIPVFPNDDPRLMDSTDALELEDIPKRLLVVGGGIIGLEMATVYDALGSKVTIVELSSDLIPGCDRDLVRPLEMLKKKYENIFTGTQVKAIEAQKKGLKVIFEGGKAPGSDTFDRVLVAVGRRPNGLKIGAENTGVTVNEHGFIPVDKQQRTNVDHIFAIGDIVGQPMLAHKATHEGKVAAQVIAGMKSWFDAKTIPSVAYTDPEIAWMGLTETEVKAQGIEYEKGAFPWAASGRALSIGRDEGLTKVLFDKENGQVIGAGIVGRNAGELIAEAVLALEMGADAEDLGLTIHPHPTLSETLNFAAEVAEGTITDLYIPKEVVKIMDENNNYKHPLASRFRSFLPVVVDVETGGFNAQTDALLEIAAITVTYDESGALVPDEEIGFHIIPFEGANIEEAAIEFNGIDPFHPLRPAIAETEALHKIFKVVRTAVKAHDCTRAILMGHNPTMDLGFLNAAIERIQSKRSPFHPFSSFDTATLGGLAYGQTVLARAIQAANIEWENERAHSAIYDTRKTAELFCNIVNRWDTETAGIHPFAQTETL